jgi:two-component system osmolarity sensor histidine kinase EnvZ
MLKKLKATLPQSLLARIFLISVLAMISSSSIATYIFYNRHWENVTEYMSESLVGEVYALTEIYNKTNDYNQIKPLENALRLKLFISKSAIILTPPPEELKILYGLLNNIFQDKKINVNFYGDNTILIQVQLDDDLIEIRAPKKKIGNSSSYIFILWMIGLSFIFFIINIIFTRNQIRPIIKLARAAELFGKGHKLHNFSISGAYEVRKATKAFLEMKSRLEKYVSQRTTMLNGISHDLRTPLTRIKLQIALSNHPELLEIKSDIDEMEILINSYLNFTKDQEDENHVLINPEKLINDIITQRRNSKLEIDFMSHNIFAIKLKKTSMKRAITNLIDNAAKFADTLKIYAKIENKFFIITFDDNGEGIPEKEYMNVFKPFYKVDQSRNLKSKGSGLGLAIVEDIINSHGGTIKLGKSEILHGLKIIITIPIE